VNVREEAFKTRQRNVLDMAITFTAMVRVFKEGAKSTILAELSKFCGALPTISSSTVFEEMHHGFCTWFVNNIVTAEKKINGETRIQSSAASYGHAAKVLDIVLKVYVFYCHFPTNEDSEKLIPLLHAAIDTPILKFLSNKFPNADIKASTIKEIDEQQYSLLQRLLGEDIYQSYQSSILPVEYDDLMWSELNRNA
jgi:hypothetical protein